MKSNIFIATNAAISMLLVASACAKQEQSENYAERKTFTASIEQEITKTTLSSEYKVEWNLGDEININGAVYKATPKSDATKTDFSYVSGTSPEAPYKAVFPVSLYDAGKFILPSTQNYLVGKFNAPMYAESDTESFSFKNICGVLCFSLKGTDKIRSISITANETVCGEFTMESLISMNMTGTAKTVTLNCGSSGVQLNTTTATKFYIYLPPRTSYTAGMKIVITNTEGGTFKKITANAVTISRNNVYTFNWEPSFTPKCALPGVFSVSSTKKVRFSQANMYAKKEDDVWNWKFYDEQYQCNLKLGNTSRKASGFDTEMDLFTAPFVDKFSAAPTGQTRPSNHSYHFSIDDGWRVMQIGEWEYLLTSRSGNKFAKGKVHDINGLLVFPDGYSVASGNGIAAINDKTAAFPSVSISDAVWSKMECDGVVFLPAAGCRYGSSIMDVGTTGCYASISFNTDDYSFDVFFDNGTLNPLHYYTVTYGKSIRLVKNI